MSFNMFWHNAGLM